MKRFYVLILAITSLLILPNITVASDTPDPTAVTVAGSLQSELGCSEDWQPDCASTHLTYDSEDAAWHQTFNVPAGSWEYKATLNNSWDENYGLHAERNGANIPLNLGSATAVKFYYDHETHWITDNQNSVIAVAPGSFQSELGCSGDWDASCLRSWLKDPDGDGIYSFSTRGLPAGNYEAKVAINESWNENYGAGGTQNGANIPFTVASDCKETLFSYNASTHVLTISEGVPAPQPASVGIPGSFQQELGCSEDWQAECAATQLTFDANDLVWQGSYNIPAGSWEYKAALNGTWDVNYGQNATPNGANIPLSLSQDTLVKFYYDHNTHWVADNKSKIIATAPGSYQSELGCSGDWQQDCLRSWLQDPDGDGFYSFSARLPAGNYEVKVTIDESWSENYGEGGAPNGPNISFTVPASCVETFFLYDPNTHILTVGSSGQPKGNLSRAQAYWVLEDAIVWNLTGFQSDWTVNFHYDADAELVLEQDGVSGGTSFALEYDPNGLDDATKTKFPHLANYPVFRIPASHLSEVAQALKAELAISAFDGGSNLMDATSLQIPGVLDDLYTYTGPLGVTFVGGAPTLRVWAPTARSVNLQLFDSSTSSTTATSVLPMILDPASGVWSISGDSSWSGKFYLYEVEVYTRATGAVETNLVTDPYSFSLSRNSGRSQIVNLEDAALKPVGWDSLVKPVLKAPEDVVIYELHTRDFSANDTTVPESWRGTFKAFTQTNSNGMLHLNALAQAGLTHVHLLPAFDIATINEDKSQWQDPGDLSGYPPDSDQQQAAVAAVANDDAFNWGYDPWHYTVPEGSYSLNPDGSARILEFREMVQALSNAGLRTVMDVVYNHTNASGQNDKSVLDRIVPGYYHRLNSNGTVERSSCCENTASEHNMMEKLMVDSVVTWAKYYKVDGFRFDLMGHHMKRNMLAVRDALDALTLAGDGVDGSSIYIYGEAWNFGEVANNARGVNAIQMNMAGTGIGSFNDRIRDGVRGGGPFSGVQEQGFLTGLYYDPNATNQGSPADQLNALLLRSDWVRVGLAANIAEYEFVDRLGNLVKTKNIDYNGQQAGYTADPQEIINYIEAHDNDTLFDAIQLKAPVVTSMANRVRMQNLGMSLVLFGQGVPFLHAGVDLLRSKSLDRNSYNSGDWFNKLDFTYLTNNWGVGLPPAQDNQANWPIFQPLLANPDLLPASGDIVDAAEHFREALAIRKSSSLFRLQTGQQIEDSLQFHNTGPSQIPGLIVESMSDPDGSIDRLYRKIVVLLNANDDSQEFTDSEFTGLVLLQHPIQRSSSDPVVQTSTFNSSPGTFFVPGRTAAVFVEYRSAADQINLLKADVEQFYAGGVLNSGQRKALITMLDKILAELQAGRYAKAIQKTNVFIATVQDFQEDGIFTAEQAQQLISAALNVIFVLQGN